MVVFAVSVSLKPIKDSRSGGARVLTDGQLVHKIYGRSDRGYHDSKRQRGETFWLEYFRNEPLVVDLVEVRSPGKHVVMQHAGNAIGKHEKLADLETAHIAARDLLLFLNDLQDMLTRHNVNHGDITPENICYDPLWRKFTLIDFAFAMFGDEFTGGRSEAWLSPIDSVAINMIRSQVYAQLAARIERGGIYSIWPFDDIGPMKTQGAPYGLIWNGIEGFMRANGMLWTDARVLDVGCGSGRFSFLALERGAASVTAIDGDRASYKLLEAALIGRRVPRSQFNARNEEVSPATAIDGPYDYCFLLNILMWIAADQGRDFMESFLIEIGKQCPKVFVMSSRRGGPGMHKLDWLGSPQSEFKYYRSLGFKTTLLARIPIWRRHRNLYCLEWYGKGRVPT